MKVAIASDLHLGDKDCTLVERGSNGIWQPGPKYGDFVQAVGKNNTHLVLGGDVLDFSVANYDTVYAAAKVFFRHLNQDGVTRRIVYIPGNHDYTLWSTVLQQANVINPIMCHGVPRRRWAVPGIIDLPTGKLSLAGVTPDEEGEYGGLFLDSLSVDANHQPAPPIKFSVAYPNLYLVTKGRESILVTHGQYFDAYWSFLRELAARIAKGDLRLLGRTQPNVEDYVALNMPLNELASASVGQAAGLSDIARTVQKEVKNGELGRVTIYLNNFVSYVDELVKFKGLSGHLKEFVSDKCIGAVRDFMLDELKIYPSQAPRYRTDYLQSGEVQARVRGYLDACLLELSAAQTATGVNVSSPSTVIFGHTHDPLPLSVQPAMQLVHWGKCISFYNTGGWLAKGRAAVFHFDDAGHADSTEIEC